MGRTITDDLSGECRRGDDLLDGLDLVADDIWMGNHTNPRWQVMFHHLRHFACDATRWIDELPLVNLKGDRHPKGCGLMRREDPGSDVTLSRHVQQGIRLDDVDLDNPFAVGDDVQFDRPRYPRHLGDDRIDRLDRFDDGRKRPRRRRLTACRGLSGQAANGSTRHPRYSTSSPRHRNPTHRVDPQLSFPRAPLVRLDALLLSLERGHSMLTLPRPALRSSAAAAG